MACSMLQAITCAGHYVYIILSNAAVLKDITSYNCKGFAFHFLQDPVLIPVELEYDSSGDGENSGICLQICKRSQKENAEGCCIKHLSLDYIFKTKATMASVTEREN
jgi:hypothetical protein